MLLKPISSIAYYARPHRLLLFSVKSPLAKLRRWVATLRRHVILKTPTGIYIMLEAECNTGDCNRPLRIIEFAI